MNALMGKRIRLIVDLDEDVRLAVRLAATKADESASKIVSDILREALNSEIEDAKKYVPRRRDKKP